MITADMEWSAEGTLAVDVRALVGTNTTVVMTLDLHANVTPLMVQNLDAYVTS